MMELSHINTILKLLLLAHVSVNSYWRWKRASPESKLFFHLVQLELSPQKQIVRVYQKNSVYVSEEFISSI